MYVTYMILVEARAFPLVFVLSPQPCIVIHTTSARFIHFSSTVVDTWSHALLCENFHADHAKTCAIYSSPSTKVQQMMGQHVQSLQFLANQSPILHDVCNVSQPRVLCAQVGGPPEAESLRPESSRRLSASTQCFRSLIEEDTRQFEMSYRHSACAQHSRAPGLRCQGP